MIELTSICAYQAEKASRKGIIANKKHACNITRSKMQCEVTKDSPKLLFLVTNTRSCLKDNKGFTLQPL